MPACLDAAAVLAALSPVQAADAIVEALRDGLDPTADIPRQVLDVDSGQLLLMPSTSGSATGVKLVSLVPGNAAHGLPTIQGTYVLFDHETLAPRALLDAGALTALRTPAVSMAAVRDVVDTRCPDGFDALVYGAGVQGVGHARALRDVFGERVRSLRHVVRSPGRADVSGVDGAEVLAITDVTQDVIRSADVIVCSTPARSPLFPASAVSPGAVVIAVGSHEPDARELDGELLANAQVVVEDVGTAMRECGDVVLAVAEGHIRVDELISMRDVVTCARTLDPDLTVVFKGSGMSWQDLVIAQAVVERNHDGPA